MTNPLMQKNRILAYALIAVIAMGSFATGSYAEQSLAQKCAKDKDAAKDIWCVVTALQNNVNQINAKLTPTVVNGQHGSTTPVVYGTPENPYTHIVNIVSQKHVDTSMVYVSTQTGGDAIVNIATDPSSINPTGNCQTINIGTVNNPDWRILGWCPESHQPTYVIQDSRSGPDTLYIFNIQPPPVTAAQAQVNGPVCTVTQTGTFQFATQSMTGFVMDCSTGDVPVADEPLIYAPIG